jgi:hypothetical protein
MKVLVSIYTHPEGYPPTFNAINNLSKKADHLSVLATETLDTRWNYDSNVRLHLLPSEKDRFKAMRRSKKEKLMTYIGFCRAYLRIIKSEKPDVILIYDNVALLLYYLIHFFIPSKLKPKLWYHNHDVFPLSSYKKYTINWFVAWLEQNRLDLVDYFSLPAQERKSFFKMERFRGQYFFIPNFPSEYFHGKLKLENKKLNDQINLVYPGNICFKHGFEELIPCLGKKVNGKELHLNLIGDVKKDYKQELLILASKHNCEKFLHFVGRISYFDVPKSLSSCQIGWAVNKPLDATYATGGTAANKIYEFVALGMPIILFDNAHYRQYLEKHAWAHFTDLSETSVLEQIKSIDDAYDEKSKLAFQDFKRHYSFESHFDEALQTIKRDLVKCAE